MCTAQIYNIKPRQVILVRTVYRIPEKFKIEKICKGFAR